MTPQEMAELHALCFTHPRPWTAEEFETFLSREQAFACSLNYGFILGHVGGPDVDLLTLAVHPEHRRKGIANALLAGFEDEVIRRGATRIFLEVAEGNAPAKALYDGFGYAEVGIRKDYYKTANGVRIQASVMSKTLEK